MKNITGYLMIVCLIGVSLLIMCWITWSMGGLAAALPLPVQHIENVAYTVPAGPHKITQKLDIYAPTEPGPWPVLVFLYGLQQSKTGHWKWERVAEQGVVVIIPTWYDISPKGVIGYDDMGFVKAFHDITCAMRFARGKAAEYGGDPTRVTLVGFSAGASYGLVIALRGEATINALTGNEGPGTCVVQEASDPPEAFVGIAGPYDWLDQSRCSACVDLKTEVPDLWKIVSPYALVEQKKIPTLPIYLIHGEQDGMVPVEVSVELHNILQAAGYKSTLTIIPDMAHGFIFVEGASEGEIILKTLQEIMRN